MSEAVVYRMRGVDGALLYIGCTGDLAARLKAHARTAAPWWPSVVSIDSEPFADRATALEAEKRAIRDEHPMHNVHHRAFTDDELAARRAGRPARDLRAEYVVASVRLTPDEHLMLKRIAAADDRSQSNELRYLIKRYAAELEASHDKREAA